MKITIVSDRTSWINAYLPALVKRWKKAGHGVRHIHEVGRIARGELVFLLGCGQLVRPAQLARNEHNLVVHESALPKGKGWSPMTWQILEGKKTIVISLFEAAAAVDSGKIYLQDRIKLRGNELVDEWRQSQAEATLRLCEKFVRRYPGIARKGRAQRGRSTFYKKRGPKDGRLDPNKSLSKQFNLLRTVDNERYPAYFKLFGETFVLKISKKRKGS